MAVQEAVAEQPDVPFDSFRNRIAVIRAEKGWNYEQAEAATGIKAENWRLWEKTGRKPQRYEEVCTKIAVGSGFSRAWVMAGGPLTSMYLSGLTSVAAPSGQMELGFVERPALASVPALV